MIDKKIKVVHILEGFLGGTGTYMCTVLPQLARKGFDVTLIGSTNRCCPNAQTKISELRASGVKVHIIPMFRGIKPLKDIYSFAIILRILLRNKFDIIHTHCSKAGVLGRVAGFIIGENARIHTPHCFAFMRCNSRFKKSFYLALEKLLGSLTTKLVAVSRSEATIALRSHIVSAHKCVTVKNGLSNGQFSSNTPSTSKDSLNKASWELKEDTQIVTTACRLVDYKGIFRFLRAARLSGTQNAVFFIAGDGELKDSAEKFIRRNKLCNRIKLLGHISNIKQLYAISDVVVLCSDAEAQPYLLLEAMCAKCPIIATSIIGNKELITHQKTGLLVNPTPVSIAKAIDELLANAEKRKEYAQNAHAYCCKNHTLEKQISELTEIYRSFYRG